MTKLDQEENQLFHYFLVYTEERHVKPIQINLMNLTRQNKLLIKD